MAHPALVLLVRFKSRLSLEQVIRVVEDREDEFRALSGLKQKYYLQDPVTGEYGGLYLWESPEALAEYRESELRATIAHAYEVEGEPRVETWRILKALREDD